MRLDLGGAGLLAARDDAGVARRARLCERGRERNRGKRAAGVRPDSRVNRRAHAPGQAQQIFLPLLPRTGAGAGAAAAGAGAAPADAGEATPLISSAPLRQLTALGAKERHRGTQVPEKRLKSSRGSSLGGVTGARPPTTRQRVRSARSAKARQQIATRDKRSVAQVYRHAMRWCCVTEAVCFVAVLRRLRNARREARPRRARGGGVATRAASRRSHSRIASSAWLLFHWNCACEAGSPSCASPVQGQLSN